jgi:hypothetical protein
VQQIAAALGRYAVENKPVLVVDKKGKVTFRAKLLEEVIAAGYLHVNQLDDGMGGKLTLETVAQLEKGASPDGLARALTQVKLQRLAGALNSYAHTNQATLLKGGKWVLPKDVLAKAAIPAYGLNATWLKDAWGQPFKLIERRAKTKNTTGLTVLNDHEIVSAGPDGKEVLTYQPFNQWQLQWVWHLPDGTRLAANNAIHWRQRDRFLGDAGGPRFGAPGGFGGGRGGAKGAPGGGGFPRPVARRPDVADRAEKRKDTAGGAGKGEGGGGGGPAPARLREYFPETLFWQPSLITDERGRAELKLPFADSITTWRLTASASSRGGLLGGVSAPLRVFQDFFVDLDLPVALTQNDEVAFPVAVYNYLKVPQTVTLNLQAEPWFELIDGLGLKRSLDLKPNQVTSVKFRIKARKVGNFPLRVTARGSKMSDDIKRSIAVLPDGKKVEQVFADRLKGKVKHTIAIPDNAIADASGLLVKVYPGVMSQVLEGVEGMIRLPGG